MTEEAVCFDHVYKSYVHPSKWVLEDFSLKVLNEEFFCLVGPSGCGKSTALKLVAGIEEPSKGKVTKPPAVSMVFQSGALLPWLSAFNNVSFGLAMKGFPQKQVKEETKRYLEMVKLEEFADKYPRELSGGQRQRVGIARSLAVKPQALLLDEPFSALDPVTTSELHRDLIKIWQGEKITVLMVSHLVEEAVMLADRVGVMSQGKLTAVAEISLPRPRIEESEDFQRLVEKINNLLGS